MILRATRAGGVGILLLIVFCGCAASRSPAPSNVASNGGPSSASVTASAAGGAVIKELTVEPAHPTENAPRATGSEPYRIGEDDELDISVYGNNDLKKTQIVRPDGKIAFPLIGDIQASGLAPEDLGKQLRQALAAYVIDPRVTVVVKTYNSKRLSILGEVQKPGLIGLTSDVSLLEAISRVGGITGDADLKGALLVRDGQVVPVDFERLLRQGDMHQNVSVRRGDVILIPNVAARKVFVLGEVRKPLVMSLKYQTNLIELLTLAGGVTKDAQTENVLVIRGGLGSPSILTANIDKITKEGRLDQNVALQSGDIVYVPRTLIADVERFVAHITNLLQPVILAESGIVLGPNAWSVLTTGKTSESQPVFVGGQ